MKKLFFLSGLLLLVSVLFAQVKKQFTVSNVSTDIKRWGILYKPADNTKKYPVVFFSHGVGEVGSTESSADLLYNESPLKFIKSGWRPNYIILALQDDKFSSDPRWYNYVLRNDPDVFNAWDGNTEHILYTGLSAGGGKSIEAVAHYLEGVLIPFSAAWPTVNYDGKKPVRSIAFHDPNDPICPYHISRDFINAVNQNTPGNGLLIDMKEGHTSWGRYYDPNYKLANGMNLYEWAFSGQKPPTGTVTTPPPPPPPPPTPPAQYSSTAMSINAGADQNITGTSVSLDGSKSTGWKTCDWQVISKPANAQNAWYDKQDYANPVWKANNLVPGTYVFRFTGYSSTGEKASDDVNVNVGAAAGSMTKADSSALTAIDANNFNKDPNGVVKIYPNPFADKVSISGLSSDNDYSLKLISLNGKVVYEKQISNQSAIDINSLRCPGGVYFLSIYDEKKKQTINTVKLVKQ